MLHVRTFNKVNTPRNQRGPLYAFYASTGLGPPNIKEQLRRGVVLATVSSVLLLVGSVLTWLVFTEVFGSKVPIMGPLVMALGILLLVLAIRQFYVVWKHKRNPPAEKQADGNAGDGGGEDGEGDEMEMDTWDTEGYKTSYTDYSYKYSEPLHTEDQGALPHSVPANTYTAVTNTSIVPYRPHPPISLPNYPYAPISLPHHPHAPMVKQASNPQPPTTMLLGTSSTNTVTPQGVDKVRSCSDLMGMGGSGQGEQPNPRPVVRYSQGQLEMLDRQAAASGSRTSPSAITNAPSHHSLGERSSSTQEHSGHRSLSLSIERTDILETI